MYTVYIIQSKFDKSYYTGQTKNLEKRLGEHNRGKNKYTKTKIPWELVYFKNFETRNEAVKKESEIKNKKSKNYIEWLINFKV